MSHASIACPHSLSLPLRSLSWPTPHHSLQSGRLARVGQVKREWRRARMEGGCKLDMSNVDKYPDTYTILIQHPTTSPGTCLKSTSWKTRMQTCPTSTELSRRVRPFLQEALFGAEPTGWLILSGRNVHTDMSTVSYPLALHPLLLLLPLLTYPPLPPLFDLRCRRCCFVSPRLR